MTVETIEPGDCMVAAVPMSDGFRRRAEKWRTSPLIQRSKIRLVLVDRDGEVDGLDID